MRKLIFILLGWIGGGAALHAQSSSVSGGASTVPAVSATAPLWCKLVKTGRVVTGYYSLATAPAATDWKQLGTPQTLALANQPLLAGIFICSHSTTALSTGTIDQVSITPASSFRVADFDIGQPAAMGSADQDLSSGVWTIRGCGADVWGTTDQCNFQPWLCWGDFTIVGRITSLSASAAYPEKIGMMIRDSFNSGSDYALVCATNGSGVHFEYRPASNANPDSVALLSPAENPTTNSITTMPIGVAGIGTNLPPVYVLAPSTP
jgi:hypothetical protein